MARQARTAGRWPRGMAAAGVAALLAAACAPGSPPPGNREPGNPAPSSETATSAPPLRVQTVSDELEHPWDLGFLPDGRVLVTERPGRLTVLSSSKPDAQSTRLDADFSDLLVRGEGGLMGLVVHPDFAQTHRFTTCQTHTDSQGAAQDVRLVTWQLRGQRAVRVVDPLLGGMPINPSGRHSGCRLELAPSGALLVGTGDTARNGVAQDRSSLGGKVLRLNLATGEAAAGNPFADSPDPDTRKLLNYGHRNVQGLAARPGTDQIYNVEHGPDVDDEVNLLRPGANYGWDPHPTSGGDGGGYNENVPMTDTDRFPEAVPAVWSSGRPTEATSGAAFLRGSSWGELEGMLAVATLKGSALLLMDLGSPEHVPKPGSVQVRKPAALDDTHGRLRSARAGPPDTPMRGALFVTTSNGSDELLRVTPRG